MCSSDLNLVDFPDFPLLRLVKGMVQGFLVELLGADHAPGVLIKIRLYQDVYKRQRRWVLTIPREIPPDQYAVLVREFCQKQFVSKGMIADFAIHDPLQIPKTKKHLLQTKNKNNKNITQELGY